MAKECSRALRKEIAVLILDNSGMVFGGLVQMSQGRGNPFFLTSKQLSSSSTLLQGDVRRAFTLDTLYTFIAQGRQIQTTKQVLPIPEEKRHDCQM